MICLEYLITMSTIPVVDIQAGIILTEECIVPTQEYIFSTELVHTQEGVVHTQESAVTNDCLAESLCDVKQVKIF